MRFGVGRGSRIPSALRSGACRCSATPLETASSYPEPADRPDHPSIGGGLAHTEPLAERGASDHRSTPTGQMLTRALPGLDEGAFASVLLSALHLEFVVGAGAAPTQAELAKLLEARLPGGCI